VARDGAATAMSSPLVQLRRPMPGNRKRSDRRRGQFGRREAGLRGGVVLVDEPTEYVVASNVAERRGSRGHCTDRCWHFESKAAMRPMLVVMPDVVAKDCFEVVTAENERPVETLFPDGPYPPLRDRVRTRRSDGRPDHLDAFGDEHLVEAGGELRVAISDQEPEGPTVLGEISCEVAGDLGDKRAGRMSANTEDVDYAALELNHEQHIELVETDRVHDEEVGGQDALGLGGEELFPGRSTARSWSETVASKDPADRARGDADPKPVKLALDANTSPAAVLPAESDDELDNLIAERGTSRTSLGSPTFPLASRELPMPAEQSLGRDEKATPAPPWKKSAEHSQDRSVRGLVADAAMELPLEHADLVAKHHQLDVLVQSCPSARSQCLKNAARDEVPETEAHNR